MSYSQYFVYALEIIGTIAFAFSGALLGIRKNMDIFGVNVLGVTTALGGGMLRDLILGINPPSMFFHPSYTLYAILTSCILFIILYFNRNFLDEKHIEQYTNYMVIMDSVGLGAFTVIGINTAIHASYGNNYYLLIFIGVITGVGGGIIRDIMAGDMPYIFVRHVYASASLIGAIVCIILKEFLSRGIAMVIGAIIIIAIRLLAAHYRWNLPRIKKSKYTGI